MIDLDKYEGHTPGPWEVSGLSGRFVVDKNGRHVVVSMIFEAAIANATLCADAPALLAEVKRLRQDLHDTIRESQQYRADRDEALEILRMYMQATPISASMALNTCYGHARRLLAKHGDGK